MTDSIYMWMNTSLWTAFAYLGGLALLYGLSCALFRNKHILGVLPLSIAGIGTLILMQGHTNAQGPIEAPFAMALANILLVLIVAAIILLPISLFYHNTTKEDQICRGCLRTRIYEGNKAIKSRKK